MSQNKVYSQDEIRDIFTKTGFRIISLESSVKKYEFPDFSSLLSNYDHLYFWIEASTYNKDFYFLVIFNCLRLIPNYWGSKSNLKFSLMH